MVLSFVAGRKKFTVAKTIIFAYNSSMKFEKDSNMTKAETIELIIEHMENQGIEHEEQFQDFCQELQTMSQAELDEQLTIVEELAIYGSTMPRF